MRLGSIQNWLKVMRRTKIQTQAYESKVPVGNHDKCSLPTKEDVREPSLVPGNA